MNEYIAGSAAIVDEIFLQDNVNGAGLPALVYNSPGLSCYYVRSNSTTSVVVALVTMTLGTYASGGFKEVDSTNMPGIYQFCPPAAAFVAGATSVTFYFQGASGLTPKPVKYRIYGGLNPDDGVHAGLSALPNTACTTNASLLTSGTGTDQLNVSTGHVNLGSVLGNAVTVDGNNVLNVSVKYWAGGLVPAPNVTGVPLIDEKYLLGTIISTPATAGILDVNTKQIAAHAVIAAGTVTFPAEIGTSTLTQTQVSGYAGPILTDNSTGLITANNTTVISNNLGYANGTPGSGTWTCPAGWTLATVLCFGAGGGGAGVSSFPGTGGGGGACAVSVLPLVPATTYNFFVGLGGSGSTDGTQTWFDTAEILYADSGYSPAAHTGNGRGGQASNCIGQFAYSGGNGGDQGFTDGGGGGGAAGPLGPGNSGGSDRFPGSGGLGSPAGGSGGMGAVSATATAAQPGQFPGGGGGAQSVNATGAAASGANGLLVIIPVLPATTINQALGATVDGSLTLLQVLTSLASFMNGALSVVNNNDGTLTLTFKKRDNSTTAFTVTFNNTTFARANAGGNG